jgi:hypothetical protein
MPTKDDLLADIHSAHTYQANAEVYRQQIERDGAAAVAQRQMQEYAKEKVPQRWAYWTREAAEAALNYKPHEIPYYDHVVKVTTHDLVGYYQRLGWLD